MRYALLDVYRVGDNIVTDTYNGSPTANAAVDELLTLDAESGVEDCGQAVMAALADKKAFTGRVICPVEVFGCTASLAPLLGRTRGADMRYAHIGERVPVEVIGALEGAGVVLLDCAACLACAARFQYQEPADGSWQEDRSPAAHSRW